MKDRVIKLAEENHGFFTCAQALEQGISKVRLQELVDSGVLERSVHGIYGLADSMGDEMYVNQLAVKKMIYSHETALFLHGMTDRTPDRYSITVPDTYFPSKRILDRCKVYYVTSAKYELGLTSVLNGMGNPIRTYDKERTVCDVIRSRNKIDIQIVLETVRNYAQIPEKDLNRLYRYAEILRITKYVRQYMEVLL